MLSRVAARAARPASVTARSAIKAKISTTRPFSNTAKASSDHGPAPPKLFGPGAKAGTVPSAYEQATGLERLQLLGDIEGIPVFDESPLDSSRVGTKKDPIVVSSFDHERLIGCTGSPADSHDVLWFGLHKDEQARCLECGSVYAMDYQGLEDAHAHAHH